jgi:hypothetical protein
MTGNPRKTGFGLVGLLIASLVVVAPQPTEAHRQDAPRAAKPDVGTVRGTLVYRFGRDSGSRPDAGGDAWVFAGKIEFPLECAIFPGTFELTIGECATRNRSIPFLKHTKADGSGKFEVSNLPIGDYTLVLRSAHVRGNDQRDLGNKLAVSWFSIKGGETVDASTRF